MEVGFGRGFDAVRLVAVVDGVQVGLEDGAFRISIRQHHREDGLFNLPREGCGRVWSDEQLLGQLLRDGAPALDDAATFQVIEGGPRNRQVVQTVVVIEGPILDGDRGFEHQRRHRAERHDDSVIALLPDVGEQGSMAIVNEQVLREACRRDMGDWQ